MEETMPADSNRNIVFGPNAKSADVSDFTLTVLRDIMRTADVAQLTITSTQRSPQDQARVMFANIARDGVARQKAVTSCVVLSVTEARPHSRMAAEPVAPDGATDTVEEIWRTSAGAPRSIEA